MGCTTRICLSCNRNFLGSIRHFLGSLANQYFGCHFGGGCVSWSERYWLNPQPRKLRVPNFFPTIFIISSSKSIQISNYYSRLYCVFITIQLTQILRNIYWFELFIQQEMVIRLETIWICYHVNENNQNFPHNSISTRRACKSKANFWVYWFRCSRHYLL